MTRDEHLAWCKKRALAHLAAGEPVEAAASMLRDLNLHPETALRPESINAGIGTQLARERKLVALRSWIRGFR